MLDVVEDVEDVEEVVLVVEVVDVVVASFVIGPESNFQSFA